MTGTLILPAKDFFSMGEASRLTQVPPHRLRYWEDQIRLLRPSRQPSGHRRYTRSDLDMIIEIKDMVERRKMTLAGARRNLIDRKRAPRDTPAASGASAPSSKILREIREELRLLVEELG